MFATDSMLGVKPSDTYKFLIILSPTGPYYSTPMKIAVEEKYFRPEELFEADSAFFCGTAAEITTIESIEGQAFQKPWKKSLGVVIQEAYQSIVLDKSYSYVIV